MLINPRALPAICFLFFFTSIACGQHILPRKDGVYIFKNPAVGHDYYGDSLDFKEQTEGAKALFGDLGSCLTIQDCHLEQRLVKPDFYRSEQLSVLYFVNDTVAVELS